MKESGARVTFCGQTVLQSSIEDEEGHVVTTCARRLAAWIHPGKEARVGGPHQASHGMEAGTSWYEIVDGLSRPYQCIRVGQVGGDGPSCSETVGTELSSWAAEIQAGDHDDPGHGWNITLKYREGGLMGDPLMVALFWVALLPSTIRWQHAVAEEGAESGQLLAWHLRSGGRVDFSLSQYANDITKQIVAELGEDVQALAKRVRMTFLTEHWRLMVFRRTEGKRSSSCTWLERAHSQIAA